MLPRLVAILVELAVERLDAPAALKLPFLCVGRRCQVDRLQEWVQDALQCLLLRMRDEVECGCGYLPSRRFTEIVAHLGVDGGRSRKCVRFPPPKRGWSEKHRGVNVGQFSRCPR